MTGSPVGAGLVRNQRFHVVDALRGIAALLVLFFHLMFNSAQTDLLQSSAPSAVVELSRYAAHGVAIFFVISGVVICYSVRHLPLTAGAAGNFALRRQVRLDPPYYAVIVLVLLIGFVESRVPELESHSFTLGEVLLNMIYLQDITGVPAVIAVAWTLCIEVQFYLVIILIMLVLRRWKKLGSKSTQTFVIRTVVLGLGVISLAMPWLGWSTGPWFLGYWWMFALGMSIAWVLMGELRVVSGWVIVGSVGLWCLALNIESPASLGGYWAAWLTAIFLLTAVRTGFIAASVPRPLTILGAWTYSLYLIHLTVIDVVMGGLFKVTGKSVAGAWFAYVVGFVASLVAAWLLYELVEKRSVSWAQWLKPASLKAHDVKAVVAHDSVPGEATEPAT